MMSRLLYSVAVNSLPVTVTMSVSVHLLVSRYSERHVSPWPHSAFRYAYILHSCIGHVQEPLVGFSSRNCARSAWIVCLSRSQADHVKPVEQRLGP